MGIVTKNDFQIVFLDTPGIHQSFNRLGDYMMRAVDHALEGIDALIFMLDATDVRAKDRELLKQYQNIKLPKFLVVNKVDLVSRETLMLLLQSINEVQMDEIMPISAKSGQGLPELVETIHRVLPEGPMYFSEDMITDQPQRQIVAEIIREKALYNLRDEIPHGIGVEIMGIEGQGERRAIQIYATIYCEKNSHKGMIIGKQGSMLRKIGESARMDIEALFEQKVNLQLWVKVRLDWRNKIDDLRTLGYE
jgi:GTP-binding protein Era